MKISTTRYSSFVLYSLLVGAVTGIYSVAGIAASGASTGTGEPAVVAVSSGNSEIGPYRILDWKDLVSPTWEPPLIQPAPDENGQIALNPASLVSSLDKLPVKLPGYMVPMKFTNNEVSEFLLVPFLPHQVTQHVPHQANQMVYVSLRDAISVSNPYEPFWVEGLITLESVETSEGDSGYHLIDARAYVYEY